MTAPAFFEKTRDACRDPELARKLLRATERQLAARKAVCGELGDVESFRDLAAAVRDEALSSLDGCLAQFAHKAEAAGVEVHWADDGTEARRIIRKVAEQEGIKAVIKSKSMVTEEIDLNGSLEGAGFEVTETDLGEFIIQLAREKPAHIVLPALHLTAEEVARIFREEIGYDGAPEAEALTKRARLHLREKFRSAGMGISGVNFALAEEGLWTVCTNEGNGRFVTGLPRVYLAIMGMERIVRDGNAAAVLLKLLARFATGQRITQYVNFTGGPCRRDGPEKVHLVILDNGRSRILGSKYRQMLRCIRCGACLNICPVFNHIGGQTFPGPYSGPMGSVLLPLQLGLAKAGPTEKACSMCGACDEICPVKIPLPKLLLELRNDASRAGRYGRLEKIFMALGARVLANPTLYRWAQGILHRGMIPLSKGGWVRALPSLPGRWTREKDLLLPAKRSFLARERKGRSKKGRGFSHEG